MKWWNLQKGTKKTKCIFCTCFVIIFFSWIIFYTFDIALHQLSFSHFTLINSNTDCYNLVADFFMDGFVYILPSMGFGLLGGWLRFLLFSPYLLKWNIMETSGHQEKVASRPQLLLGIFMKILNKFWRYADINRFLCGWHQIPILRIRWRGDRARAVDDSIVLVKWSLM